MFNLVNVPGYHLEYRVHSSDIGWQDWVKQGNYAGNSSKDIQAIDFRLVADDTVKVNILKFIIEDISPIKDGYHMFLIHKLQVL